MATKVFISYAKENRAQARRLFEDLQRHGFEVWFDEVSLMPGEIWRSSIQKAIRESRYFVALLSSESVSKRGYVQKELKTAMDVLDEFPENVIFLIPVRLDDCKILDHRLMDLHYINLFPDYEEGFSKILRTFSEDAKNKEERKAIAQNVIRAERGSYVLLKVPGGTFTMGSPESERVLLKGGESQHEVLVPEFYMGIYPVTNEQYGQFLKEFYGLPEPEFWNDRRLNQPQQPVVGVSWDDLQPYVTWTGLRLPSEAEWEYACRAGTRTRFYRGNKYKDLDRAGWYIRNSYGQSHPVGGKEPNAFGLYDMHGNVLEWVEDDWHSDYKGAPDDGDAWIDEPRGSQRVIRGGSWYLDAQYCRSACRGGLASDCRVRDLGFRLAKSVNLEF